MIKNRPVIGFSFILNLSLTIEKGKVFLIHLLNKFFKTRRFFESLSVPTHGRKREGTLYITHLIILIHEDTHQLCGRVFHAVQAANERPMVQAGNFDKCSLIHRRT